MAGREGRREKWQDEGEAHGRRRRRKARHRRQNGRGKLVTSGAAPPVVAS